MKLILLLSSERVRIPTKLGTITVCLMAVMLAGGQTGPGEKPPMAEKVFKNVQVLKGIPVDQFMATMGFISASLGMTCTDCHIAESGGSWEKYADDTELKQTTRKMLVMVSALNRTYFGGRREVTCYSCHRGGDRPKVTPSLVELYGAPPPPEPPDTIEQAAQPRPADPILDKYIQALGGAQRLAKLTSFVAKGTYVGFGETDKTPLEIFAKGPEQRSMIVHTTIGDSVTAYDGHIGWTAAPEANTPVPVLELSDGELEGAKLDADLSFPADLKQALRQWRAGAPATIDDREVQVVQGTSDGRYPVDFYFDPKSGLLLRVVRYSESPLGLNPTQIDYADYREVAGVKMPFRWTVTWLSGRSTIELTDVQPNVPIDAAKFAKPRSSAR
jgi:photosynthetic reaction center cytochrome c subunit